MKAPVTAVLLAVGLSACAQISPIDPEATIYDNTNVRTPLAYLKAPFSYCNPTDGRVIIIPAGFETDYTSIPWPAYYFLPRTGEAYENAAFVHDYLYAFGAPGMRKYADDVMLNAMKEYNVDWLTRHIIYYAVRMGGSEGYGREADWLFFDAEGRPREQRRVEATYSLVLEGCQGYDAMVLSGELYEGFDFPDLDPAPQAGPDQP